MSKNKIRWGILSTGSIANSFAEALNNIPDAELSAVASRDISKAKSFAEKHGADRAFGSYVELAEAPDIDVIYIGTPHIFHHRDAKLCLEAGKNVLCEKAFTINATEAKDLVNVARSNGLFLMEAMWNRYMPSFEKIRSLLEAGTIGDLKRMHGSLAFDRSDDPRGRLFELELGGGALLDLGIYPLAIISHFFGIPEKVYGFAEIGDTGADYQSEAIMKYADGRLASFYCALNNNSDGGAWIEGSKGKLHIHSPLYKPEKISLYLGDHPAGSFDCICSGNGYEYEALEVMRCLRSGLLESPLMPLDESIALMEIMDTLRAQWGLVYPGEKTAT